MAVAAATSPAAGPPMPSATANRGLATRSSSWLLERTRPTSVAAPARSSIIGGLPWSSCRSGACRPCAWSTAVGDLPLVEVGAVGGPEVLDVEIAVAAEHPGVQLGHEGVVGDRHPAAAGPPDGHLVAEGELLAPAIGGLHHDQPLAARGLAGREREERG